MRRTGRHLAVAVLAAMVVAWTAVSAARAEVGPDEVLRNPAQEARAREIGKSLRCVVCQNQSIDESNADLARDMRIMVRKRIKAGDTNKQIMDYMVSRYGDFVLLDPPFKASTYILWLGPAAIGLAGLFAMILYYRRRRAEAADAPAPTSLSADEEARLKALMGGEDA